MQELDYLPIASLNQYNYCPHRCWRILCAGEFQDNQHTIEGTSIHSRVHDLSQGYLDKMEQIRAIWLKSDQYRLIGKADLIESEAGEIYPVEYKKGKKGDWDNDALQVCAQALCLEEMTGKLIHKGYVYYAHSHQRQLIQIDSELRDKAITTIEAIQTLITTRHIPLPIYNPRCKECSLYSSCVPQAREKIKNYHEE